MTGLFWFAELKDIVLIPVHTKPEDSEKELDELYEVFLAVRDKWKTDVSCISVSPERNNLMSRCYTLKLDLTPHILLWVDFSVFLHPT